MKKIYILVLFMTVLLCFNTSCNNFLEEEPDNRSELNTEDNIKRLLVSAYPQASPTLMYEFMSDNTDRNAETGLSVEYRYYDDLWFWKDSKESASDNPKEVWEASYLAIASSNYVLDAIEKMGNPENMKAVKAEAYIARAYNHFILVNTFCMPYGNSSKTDMGIPYVEIPETTVSPKYDRGTVDAVYAKINSDIEAALPYIDDNIYTVPKYHFNKKAAYAFAARFNLYYTKFDKAITYATKALGENPASVLRDWQALSKLEANQNYMPDNFVSMTNKATLMVNAPMSNWGVTHGIYGATTRYTHNTMVSKNETIESYGPWTTFNNLYIKTWTNSNIHRVIFRKIGNYFHVTNPQAGTGYRHTIEPLFTTDETLLVRAEAYALLKNYTKSMEDMTMIMKGFSKIQPTFAQATDFYAGQAYYEPSAPTPKKRLNPDFEIEQGGVQENLLQYILHVRRIITVHEGLRWLDVKRYGITLYRRTVTSDPSVLKVYTDADGAKPMGKNDKRLAIQLPDEVIKAGLPANPR